MKTLNLRLLDLNLLFVFDMVYRERSVTRAAAKLNLTQSAISQALGRMRAFVDDDLFVRTPEGMEPTALANALIGPVRDAFDSLQTALNVAAAFDSGTADQVFTLAVDNRAALILAPRLAAEVKKIAPSIRLDFKPGRMIDLANGLDRSELDLVVGSHLPTAERFVELSLFDDRCVILVRKGHPLASGRPFSIAELAAYPYLSLTSTGEDDSFIDHEFALHGLHRRIELRAPLLAATASLVQSDLVTVVSERTARAFESAGLLAIVDIPFETPNINVSVAWHRRNDGVAAHRWLRDVLVRIARKAVEGGGTLLEPDSSFTPQHPSPPSITTSPLHRPPP